MYLHIGQNTVVRFDDIIGIFDIESSTVSPDTKEYLNIAQKSGRIVNVNSELPKSFIVCGEKDRHRDGENGGRVRVYISQISSTTLLKRAAIGGRFSRENG